jgi:hypothetical protein
MSASSFGHFHDEADIPLESTEVSPNQSASDPEDASMPEASFSSQGSTLIDTDPPPPYSEYNTSQLQGEASADYREHVRRSSAPSPEPHFHQVEEERFEPRNSCPDSPSPSPHPLVLPEAYNFGSRPAQRDRESPECRSSGSEAHSHGDLSSASTALSDTFRGDGTMNGSHPRQPPAGPRGTQPHINNHNTNNNSADHSQSLTSPTTPSEPHSATRRLPNFVQVAKAYVFEQQIQNSLSDLGVSVTREDNIRLAGVQWIDNVRRALKL